MQYNGVVAKQSAAMLVTTAKELAEGA